MLNEPVITIEKGIPIPNNQRGRPIKYPFADLQIGDSFFIACPDDLSSKTFMYRLSAAMRYAASRNDAHYVSRLVAGGRRVWRIE